MQSVIIYTDGGYKSHVKLGAWACLLMCGEHSKELYGVSQNTTNNKMELTAVIKAVQALKKPCKVKLYSDSEYVVKGMTLWIKNWIANGWKTKDRKKVANRDLWEEILKLSEIHQIEFLWVKGHEENKYNNRVDALCSMAIEECR